MAVDMGVVDQWLVQNANSLELDFMSLQGLWTEVTLAGEDYVTHGMFRRGERVTSVLLPSLVLDVDAVLEA